MSHESNRPLQFDLGSSATAPKRASGSPILIASCDRDGRFVFVNHPYAERFGLRPADFVGKNIREVLGEEVVAVLDPYIQAALRGEHVEYEAVIPYRSLGNRYMRCTYEPEFDDQGLVTGYIAVISDITDQKQFELALNDSEQRFRGLIDQAPFSVQILAPDGRTLAVNRAWEKLWGSTLEKITGYNVLQDPQLHAKGTTPYLRRAFAGEVVQIPAIEYNPKETLPDATVYADAARWVSAVAYPLKDAEGNVQQVVLVHDDITEKKRSEESLREEARNTETLHRIGKALAAQLDLEKIVQIVTDEATAITGAEFGAFFYNVTGARGEAYTLFTISGVPRQAFAGFPMPRNTAIFDPTFRGEAPVRLDDVTLDPRFGKNAPYHGMPAGHLPVKSYLAVPVISRSGSVLGGLFFGHSQVGRFTDRHERLVAGIAAQAAVAIDNATLYGQLRDSEERLRLALDAGRMGVWDWHIRTGELKWSPNLEPIHGFAPGTFPGTVEAFQTLIYPADRPLVQAAIAKSIETRTGYDIEFRIVWPDGSIHWMAGKGNVVLDKGEVVRMVGTGMDITKRKRAEHNNRFLADASATLAALVDYQSTLQKLARLAVPSFADWCAVDMLEPSGSLHRLAVAHVDPAKIELAHEIHRRFPPDPAAPYGVWNVIRTAQPELVSQITDAMLAVSVQDPEYLQFLRALGLRSYMAVPLLAHGKVLGVVTFIAAESGRQFDQEDLNLALDLAHRAGVAIDNARLYAELREADRRKDEFLATLAHELRNPLAPIRNSLQIIKMPAVDQSLIDRSHETMERQVRHLVRLVDDLLDVSRVMRGKIELRKERIGLATVVAHAVETAQPLIDAQGHELTISLPPAPPQVDADSVRLAQVVSNLLTNAAKYTPRGGQIWLSVAREDPWAVIRVRDTGIGLAGDMLAKIFDLFVQVDNSVARSQGGLGIGLTLVRTLVEMHGGIVSASSPGLGQGSEFTVQLPLASVPPARLLPSGRTESDPSASRGVRVLVVDDNIDAADSLAMLLRLQGHDVQVAHSGQAALEKVQSKRPDIMILDLGMPIMDGYEVARRLQADGQLGQMLLVALTGWGQDDDRRRSQMAGFDVHLVKPVEPAALDRMLHHPKLSRVGTT